MRPASTVAVAPDRSDVPPAGLVPLRYRATTTVLNSSRDVGDGRRAQEVASLSPLDQRIMYLNDEMVARRLQASFNAEVSFSQISISIGISANGVPGCVYH